MRITAKPIFRDCHDVSARLDAKDPRLPSFAEETTMVDLKDCQVIWPAAVLWITVYLLLAARQGSRAALQVPGDPDVSGYLDAAGVYDLLEANDIAIEAGHTPQQRRTETLEPRLRPQGTQILLPLTNFHSITEADALTNQAFERLRASNAGTGSLHPLISEVFGELAMNAVQHAESTIGAFGLIQFFRLGEKNRFVCCVADGGIGVRESLGRNPANREMLLYDWIAVEYATQELVTGTLDPHRGIGLFGVAQEMRAPGRNLLLHSGRGWLKTDDLAQMEARRTRLFPGTLALVSIPT